MTNGNEFKASDATMAEKKAMVSYSACKPTMKTGWVNTKGLLKNKVSIFSNPVLDDLNGSLEFFDDTNLDVMVHDLTEDWFLPRGYQ